MKNILDLALIAILIIISYLIVMRPAQRAESTSQDQAKITDQALKNIHEARSQLTRLGPPDSIPLHKSGQVKNFAAGFSHSAEILQPLTDFKPSVPKPIKYTRISMKAQNISQINNLLNNDSTKTIYNDSSVLVNQTYGLIHYHSQLLESLANLMEYDPALDIKEFDLKTPNTQQRVQSAEKGLNVVKTSLDNFKALPQDTGFYQIKQQVALLQISIDKLKHGGKPQAWATIVNSAQRQIISNRQAYWMKQSKPIISDLKSNYSALTNIQIKLNEYRF
jgi:hypothetical protein